MAVGRGADRHRLAAIDARARVLLVPYLLWVTFAGYLNMTIVRLNGPFS